MSARKKIYIAISVFALIFLTIFIFAAPFFIEKIISTSNHFIENKQVLEKMRQEEYNAVIVERDFKKTEAEIENLEKGLLSREEILNFISAVRAIAKETNVSCDIRIASQGAGDSKSELGAINFQASVNGKFPDFIRFLKGLEAMPYFMQVDSVQISQASSKTEEGVNVLGIGANLGLRVYFEQ